MKKVGCIILLVSLSTMGAAQETGFEPFKTGIAAYSGATIFAESYDQQGYWLAGIAHLTSRIAVRPKILLYFKSREDENIVGGGVSNDYNDNFFGAGIDGLYYWPLSQGSLVYAGPSVRYLRYVDKFEDDTGDYGEEVTDTFTFGLLLGGQYMLSDRFGFFGDAGISISQTNILDEEYDGSDTLTFKEEENIVLFSGLAARLGAIFYFN